MALDTYAAGTTTDSVVFLADKADSGGTSYHIPAFKLISGGDDTNGGFITSTNQLYVAAGSAFAIQENGAALTALQLIDDIVVTLGTGTYTEATTKGAVVGAVRNDTLAALAGTDNEVAPLQVDASGALYVNISSGAIAAGSATIGDVTISGSALTALQLLDDTVRLGGDVAGNTHALFVVGAIKDDALTSIGGSVTDGDYTQYRVNARGALWVELDSTNDAKVTLDGEAVVLGAGTAAIGKLTANSGIDIGDVDVLSIAAGATLIGDVGLSGARTSGGTTLYANIDVDQTEDQVKGTAGQVYWIHAMNLTASVIFLKVYNVAAASVTVGTTVPDLTFPIPTQGDTNGAGFMLSIPNGIAFSTAITIACTTGIATADTGAPAANACVVNMGYA